MPKKPQRHQRVYKAFIRGFGCAGSNQIDIFMFSVSFVIVMFYCFFKERTWRLLRTPPRRNDFGFNTELGSVFAFVIYSFIEEILKPDPRKKKIFCFCRYRSGRTRAEWTIRTATTDTRPTNQQLTRWFMDTLRNDTEPTMKIEEIT
jgi:hypothetical protein